MGLHWHCFDLRNRVVVIRKRREKRDGKVQESRKEIETLIWGQKDDEDEEPRICVCEGK